MAELKVDIIRHDYNEAKGKLIVWLFNDPSFYSAKAWKLTAKYDFGRKPNDADGNPTDKKQKLLVGLYREPFRDGWKYTINEKVHPQMVDTVLRYIFFGFQENKDGEMEPFTYLRHNRKALGIHYLFERYIEHCKTMKKWISQRKKTNIDYRDWFDDYDEEPYFPTPQTYKGYNIATKWDGTSYNAGVWRYKPNKK